MIKNLVKLSLIIFLFNCCSDSDSGNDSGDIFQKDLTIIAQDNSHLFQIDILNRASNITTTNLTETLGVKKDYNFIKQTGSLISFFTLNNNNYSVFQKNILTSEIYSNDQICTLDDRESKNIPAASNQKLILFTTEWDNADTYNFLRIYDKETKNCVKLEINSGFINGNSATFVNGEMVYATYRNAEKRVLIKINLLTNQIENELIFDSSFGATIRGEELHVFFLNKDYKVYNTSNFDLISSNTLQSNFEIPFGFFKTDFYNNEMLIDFLYPQPAPINQGPATVDLTTGEIVRGENTLLWDLRRKILADYQMDVSLLTYSVDLENNVVVCGYSLNYYPNVPDSGGIVYSNFEGEILKLVEFEYVPIKVIIR